MTVGTACLSVLAQIHTSTLTHTHNTTLHCHWHTFPEANPVDRSHTANPLSEQWFPNVRKPQNPLRSENNKLIKLYLLKNKKCMIPSMIFGAISLWVQKLNVFYHFKPVWLFLPLFSMWLQWIQLLSLRTQNHHKSIIKVVHLTCELYAKSNEFKQVCVRRSRYSQIIFSSSELLKG